MCSSKRTPAVRNRQSFSEMVEMNNRRTDRRSDVPGAVLVTGGPAFRVDLGACQVELGVLAPEGEGHACAEN